ncbi:MAG: hypothetical protein ACREQH_14825, partial [Candidatus Binatus sp.]
QSLATASVEQTAQATAAATPSYTGSVSVSDTFAGMTGSGSSSQTSAADGTSISVNAAANMSSDNSVCTSGLFQSCVELNQGLTAFQANFCLGQPTTYTISGSAVASATETTDFSSVAVLSISSLTSMMDFVNIQASPGDSIPISMDLMLPADCYEFDVEVYADTLGQVSASGTSAASCNVQFSPSQ